MCDLVTELEGLGELQERTENQSDIRIMTGHIETGLSALPAFNSAPAVVQEDDLLI